MTKIIFIIIAIFLSACATKLSIFSANKNSSNLLVAVFDTGIDYGNSNYKKRIVTDLDGQSTIFSNLKDTNDPGHGTHVAHTILDRTNEQIRIVPYKLFDYSGDKNRESIKISSGQKLDSLYKKPIESAVKNNIKIVNISGGYNTFREDDYEAFKSAKDVLFIVASGNYVLYQDEKNNIPEDLDKYFIASQVSPDHPQYNQYQYNYYPCAYRLENIICVGDAVSNVDTDEFRVLSNYGSFFIDVFANGENVLAMGVGGKQVTMSGSSMAVPKITAAFANEWVKNPTLSIKDLKEQVFKTFKTEPFYKQASKFGYYLSE